MLKTLKVIVVLLFVLSGIALTLCIMLFNRRQILLGRTLFLERGITRVATTLEAHFPDAPTPLTVIPRDIDSVSPEAIEVPRTGNFWESYKQTLEIPATETIRLANRHRELQSFFKIDPVTQKPLRDPITRERIRTGPGTTQGVLDDVVKAAEQQLNRLNETRYQLVDLRKEYLTTTSELNRRKRELRSTLCQIVDRDGQITSLYQTIEGRDETIAEQGDQLADLNGHLLDSKHIVALQTEDIDRLSNNVSIWQRKYQALIGQGNNPPPKCHIAMSPGHKGKVASVDAKRNYIVMELGDAFLAEYRRVLAQDSTPPTPTLMVTRKHDGQDSFIAKVKLGRINVSQGLAVGSILASWQQDTIRVNDEIVY